MHAIGYINIDMLQACGYLLGNSRPLGSLVCDVFLCFVIFLFGVLGQVWYLIVRFPELCILPYFYLLNTYAKFDQNIQFASRYVSNFTNQ